MMKVGEQETIIGIEDEIDQEVKRDVIIDIRYLLHNMYLFCFIILKTEQMSKPKILIASKLVTFEFAC